MFTPKTGADLRLDAPKTGLIGRLLASAALPRQAVPAAAPGNRRRRRALAALGLAGMLSTGWMADPAWANPQQGTVVAGSAVINSTSPTRIDILQSSDRAIIDWRSFSIAAGEQTVFHQPGAGSVTLNRVTGGDPSAIFGQLQSNGTVMLVNPNGIVFGAGSKIDVGGLVATTADIDNADFMAGRYDFRHASPNSDATIVNAGEISIRDHGLAALVAPGVENSGIIRARLGEIALGGARTFALDFHGDGLLSFGAGSLVTEAPRDASGAAVGALVRNSGQIVAEGGTVEISARAVKSIVDNVINTDGVITATAVSAQNGRITLSGGDGAVAVAGTLDARGSGQAAGGAVAVSGGAVAVAAGARIDASGPAGGGRVAIEGRGAGSQVQVAGAVDVGGKGAGAAGGTAIVTGSHVELADGASVDASGGGKGGRIFIGGDYHGGSDAGRSLADAPIATAQTVTVARTATLRADGGRGPAGSGDGGSVVVWSDQSTTFRGTASARGGAAGGDGGFVEVSGKTNLTMRGSVDLSAAKGAVGTFVLDPLTLKIVGGTSGTGTLDDTAGGGNLPGGTADDGANTITVGLLQSFGATANIVLEASGLITVEATGLIDLATSAGHSFVLRSTGSGGIVFSDPTTEIRTQGGSIELHALGTGSLSNIGRLTTNGGNITLNGANNVALAGSLNAGGGTVRVNALSGSLTAASGTLLTGGTVALNAAAGSVGTAAAAVATSTANLAVSTGGSAFVGSNLDLSSLTLVSTHGFLATGTFVVTAPQLTFQVTDTAGATKLDTIADATGLTLSVTNDRTLQLGTINAGTGAVTLKSTGGSILNDGNSGTRVTASSLTMTAQGAGAGIGAAGAGRIDAAVSSLNAVGGAGGVYLSNTAALAAGSVISGGAIELIAGGNLTVGALRANGTVTLRAGGSVLDDGVAGSVIAGSALSVVAEGGSAGTSANHLVSSAGTLSVEAATGGIFVDLTGGSANIDSLLSGNGAIAVTAVGQAILGDVISQTSSLSNSIALSATAGFFLTGAVNAGTQGDVTLTATAGNITGFTSTITGRALALTAGTTGGQVSVRTAAASTITASAGELIQIYQTGSVTLTSLQAGNTVSVESQSGDLTVGSVRTSNASFETGNGNIFDDGVASTRLIATSNLVLNSSKSVGAAGAVLGISTTQLTVRNRGHIHLDNDAILTDLTINNRHPTAGVANTLSIVSPYLTFDVTDSGSQYSLNSVVGPSLESFSFTGDQTMVLGRILGDAGAAFSLTALEGSLFDDGNQETRITGSTLTLTADKGNVGAIGTGDIDVNTATLQLSGKGDIVVSSITDFSTLNVMHRHSGNADAVLQFKAPSLVFQMTDSASGYNLANLSDITGINFNFNGDRTLTLGTVNLTRDGLFVASASGLSSILDDGNQATQVLANNVSLTAGGSIGAGTANGDLDLIGDSVSVQSNNGDAYVRIVRPNSASEEGTNLSVSAFSGKAVVDVDQGNLRNSSINAGGAVSVTLDNGSWVSGSVFGNAVTLDVSGSIGTVGQPFGLTAQTLTAQVRGGDITLNSNNAFKINSLTAAGTITLRSSGTIEVGTVAAAGQSVSLTATFGSIIDDGSAATGITAGTLILAADNGSIGAVGEAIAVAAPSLELSTGGNLHIAGSVALTSLSVLHTNGVSSQGNTYSITAPNATIAISDGPLGISLDKVTSTSALAFSFKAHNDLRIGAISTAGGSTTIESLSGSIFDDEDDNTRIASGAVTLASGNGSIGAAGAGAVDVSTASLSLNAFSNIHVADDMALASLAIASDNSLNAKNVFDIAATGQTFTISDSGTGTHYLESVQGTGLQTFSFTGRKGLKIGVVTADTKVTLATSGSVGGSAIAMDGASGSRITAGSVNLETTSGGSVVASVGSSGTKIAVSTSNLAVTAGGDVHVVNDQNLTSLSLTLRHPSNAARTYSISANNISAFKITDGTPKTTLSEITATGLDFSLTTDRTIEVGTLNVGTGSVSLTSKGSSSASSNASSILDDGNDTTRITAGSVSLSARNSRGKIGDTGTGSIDTSTANLTVASGGNIYVSNNTALNSLAVTANHAGSTTNTYSISASNLTAFNLSDNATGTARLTLTAITASSDLDLSFSSDRALAIGAINVGGGTVSLKSDTIYDDGNNSTAIVADELVLNATQAGGVPNNDSERLDTDVNKVSGTVTGLLRLTNDGTLTLGAIKSQGVVDITATNGSLLSDGASVVSGSRIVLTAANGSIGTTATPMAVDTRVLTLNSGGNLAVANAGDLYTLKIDNTHALGLANNTLVVTAKNLSFDVTDDGTRYAINNLVDATGLDFDFTGDLAIQLGTINLGSSRDLALTLGGSGTRAITDDGTASTEVTAGTITVRGAGSVGTAADRIVVNADEADLAFSGNLYLKNNLDFADLAISATPGAAVPVVYQMAGSNLTFDVTDDGNVTTINNVTDTTGLRFLFDTTHALTVRTLDTTAHGTVTLRSDTDILGGGNSSEFVVAASTDLLSELGSVGAATHVMNLRTPVLSISSAKNLYFTDALHTDQLTLRGTSSDTDAYTWSGTATGLVIAGSHGASGYAFDTITDTAGVRLTLSTGRSAQLGTVNLGTQGTATITSEGGSLTDDGNDATLISGGVVRVNADGALGAAGTNNSLEFAAGSVSASARTGGAHLTLTGRTGLNTFSAGGDSSIDSKFGDIRLGNINLSGDALTVSSVGSILSGEIFSVTNLTLTAAGSIGSESPITVSPSGTATLTATAGGSVALSGNAGLTVTSLTAGGDVKLSTTSGTLTVGTVSAAGKAVSLSNEQGDIVGATGNLITGASVEMEATNGVTARSIGSATTAINVDTAKLTVAARANIYVANAADLTDLTVSRANNSLSNPGGTISVTAQNLTFTVSDTTSTTTLTNVTDTTGLNFTFDANHALKVGTIDVTGTGKVKLTSANGSGDGSITVVDGTSLITGQSVALQTNSGLGGGGFIGTGSAAVRLATQELTASTQKGGLYISQTGTLALTDVASGGALSVTSGAGDLVVGTLSYGNGSALSLTAAAGRILDDGVSTTTIGGGNAAGSVTLSAQNGIGTADTALGLSTASPVTASVTGTGSMHLVGTGSLEGGLTLSTANGAIAVIAAGNIKLTSATAADGSGNDIAVTSTGGNIAVGAVTAGTNYGAVALAAGGAITGISGSNLVTGLSVALNGANGIGTSGTRVRTAATQLQADSAGGDIFLATSGGSVLSLLRTGAGEINVTGTGEMILGGLQSTSGNITVSTTGSRLVAGSIGTLGQTQLTASAGAIVDDGDAASRIAGSTVILSSAQGLGTSSHRLGTDAGALTAGVTGAGGIHLAERDAVTLTSITAANGAIDITTGGTATVTSVVSSTDAAGRDIAIAATDGNLVLSRITAGASHGGVTLQAANGSILQGTAGGGGQSVNILAHDVSLQAKTAVGTITDFAAGAGTAISITASTLDSIATTAADSTINVSITGNVTLGGGVLDIAGGKGGKAILQTSGSLNVSAGVASTGGDSIALLAGTTLTLPTTGFATTGDLRLAGTTDIVASGGGRTLTLSSASLHLRSGSKNGDTTLATSGGKIDAALTGAGNLIVDNTGAATLTALATSDGNITATATGDVTVTSAVAGGTSRTIDLTSTTGNVTVGTVNAGSSGTVVVSAANGALLASGSSITANKLDLTVKNGIGSADSRLSGSFQTIAAEVTGTGDIYLGFSGAGKVDGAVTKNGLIDVLAGGALTIGDAIVAGGDGKGVTLAAGGGIFNGMTGGTAVTGASATLKAGGAIGSTGAPLTTKVGELIATTTAAGSININEADTLTVTNATVANGSVVIVAGGATTVTSIVSNTNAAGRNVSVTVNSGDLTVGAIDAKTQGNVTLTASSGRILDDEALLARTTVIAGNAVTLTAAGGIGTAGANLDLAANSLTATVSGAGVMNLSQTGRALEATDVRTANGAITLASDAAVVLRSVVSETTSTGNAIAVTAGGHVDIGKVDAGASGDVAIVTTAGSVRAATGLPSTPALTADAVELTSAGGISLTAPAIGLTFNTLSAEVTGTGSIVIARPQATTFGTLTTAHGNIILQTAGAMTVTGAITAGKGGSIGLTATGSTVTLQGDVAGGGLSIAGGAVLTGTSRVIDTSAGTGGIAIGGALEASGVDVTLNAGGGAITLGGAVGATQRLGDLVLNSTGLTTLGGAVRAASLTTNAGGALALDGGVVDTTGAQNYGEAVTLGANTALTATTVSFGGAVDAATAGQQTLTVTGNAALNGAVGTTNALGALTVSGQTAFGHGTVTTTGAQGYNTAVLNAATKLTTANAAVSFAGAVDGGNTLTVNAGSGAITFSGAVGATQRLGAVTLNSSGATTLGGTVRAEGVTTNAGGTVALNGGSVDTTGLQSYGDAVTLGVNTTLIGNALFGGTVNAANAGQQTLTVTGDTVLNGAVGGTSALGALKIAGQTTFGHGAVTTSGAQGYGSALLSVATTLTASDAAVSFAGAVDGGKALTVNAGSGTITLGGAVGATQRLGAIVLNSTGATTFGGTVRAASVTTDAGGTVALNGGAVDTIGAQSYGEAATLGANMILTTANAAVTFGGTVDGARALTVNAGSGAVTLTSAVGSQTRLGAVTINSSGATILQGAVRAASLDTSIGGTLSVETNSIDTTGAQRYGERFVVRNDLTLQGSEVVFSGAVDGLTAGGQALAIVGGARFGGVVGADQALRSLSVSGATAFDGGRVVTTGAQQYGGAATLLRDTVLVAGGLAFGGTVDAASRSALTLDAGTGDVSVAGAVGANGTLGRVEIADATDVTFQGSVDATDFIQTNGSGETRLGAVRTDGATGIQLTGTRFTFAGPLVASGGKLSVDTGTTGGAVVFGANANVQTASGVSQSGTGPVSLASNISVQKGDIVFQSSVQLQGSDIRMSTDGLISLAGAIGPSTTLRLTSRTGGLVIGKLDGTSQEKADLGALIVDFASFGTVFGRIEGGEGGLAALRVRSGLRGEEYVANGTPWGYMPAASEVVAPTRTPGTATSLPGVFSVSNAAIDTLGAARAPEVLTTAGNIDVLGIGNSPQVLGAPRPAQPIGNQPTGSQPAGNQPTGSGPAPAAPAEQGGGQGGEQGSNGTNEDEAEAE